MNRTDRFAGGAGVQFHPVAHYCSPADVLDDGTLSPAEKRIILSCWASDIYAVDSHPALRKIPGIAVQMRIADIFAALRQLDDEENASRSGAAAVGIAAQAQGAARSRQPGVAVSAPSRWSSEANVRRYRR